MTGWAHDHPVTARLESAGPVELELADILICPSTVDARRALSALPGAALVATTEAGRHIGFLRDGTIVVGEAAGRTVEQWASWCYSWLVCSARASSRA